MAITSESTSADGQRLLVLILLIAIVYAYANARWSSLSSDGTTICWSPEGITATTSPT
ncbi:MAG TPA: hypothetical protein V6D09_07145 [Leptolyngbyaceae cyanobacterium]